MGSRGSWAKALCCVAITATALVGCTDKSEKPTDDQHRARHLERVRETYRLGRSEGLAMQEQKINSGAAPSKASPSERECSTRWDKLGERKQTGGDRAGFIAACSSFPAPGTNGYDEAVAEAGSGAP
ncbi:hypothetical protein [Streptomyces flavofungini]|uniref:hypothetical protein n=1 Tax=Streptomyces flavofungini TaxID=68200 RepID=UPI0025B1A7CD|nr:hypothetical protein [Streptomyces flavofungini]WJV48871.1 hypothetical protein QUY26_27190 [Streptomyces flavofungini]